MIGGASEMSGNMWVATDERLPEPGQVVLVWLQGAYSLAYLNREVWYAVDRYRRAGTIGAVSCVRWWMELPGAPEIGARSERMC